MKKKLIIFCSMLCITICTAQKKDDKIDTAIKKIEEGSKQLREGIKGKATSEDDSYGTIIMKGSKINIYTKKEDVLEKIIKKIPDENKKETKNKSTGNSKNTDNNKSDRKTDDGLSKLMEVKINVDSITINIKKNKVDNIVIYYKMDQESYITQSAESYDFKDINKTDTSMQLQSGEYIKLSALIYYIREDEDTVKPGKYKLSVKSKSVTLPKH